MYVTLEFDDNGCCRIHSISDDGNGWIVINERYVVMPWKMVTRHGKNMTLAEAVDGIFSQKESEAKESERRERKKERSVRKHAEYYEAHMKKETERLKGWVNWYEVKLNEIREAPIDEKLQKLGRLYRISERNEHTGVMISSAGVINPVNYPVYPPELKIPVYDDNEENPFCDVEDPNKPRPKTYDQVDYFKKVVRSYQGRDEDADKYIKKVKHLIDDSQSDDLKLEQVRIAIDKVKCPRKLDISVFYQLNGRLPHEDLDHDDERLLFHFYDTFYNESIKLFGKTIRCRTNVLYHLLDKVGKEPNADSFQFMKGPSHQRTEEEIEFIFDSLGWNYSRCAGPKGLWYLLMHLLPKFH